MLAWQHWDNWYPASDCFWTGKSNAGGSETISWSYTTTITVSAGLDINIIKDKLSASLGVEVSKSESHSESKTCKSDELRKWSLILQQNPLLTWR